MKSIQRSEAHRKASERYRKKNEEACRARIRDWNKSEHGRQIRGTWEKRYGKEWRKKYHLRLRMQVIEGYGGICACCGEAEPLFLAIDHVNGGGHKERKEKRLAATNLLRHLIKSDFPPEYRLLCHNCNMARGIYGFCPHEELRNEIA